jgi:hypothetical protein
MTNSVAKNAFGNDVRWKSIGNLLEYFTPVPPNVQSGLARLTVTPRDETTREKRAGYLISVCRISREHHRLWYDFFYVRSLSSRHG